VRQAVFRAIPLLQKPKFFFATERPAFADTHLFSVYSAFIPVKFWTSGFEEEYTRNTFESDLIRRVV
jgi:hypothetical protein